MPNNPMGKYRGVFKQKNIKNIKQHEKGVNWGYTTTWINPTTPTWRRAATCRRGQIDSTCVKFPKRQNQSLVGEVRMEVVVGILMAGRDMRAFPGVGNFLYFELGNGFIGTHLCRNLLRCSCYLTKKRSKKSLRVTQKSNTHKTIKDQLFPTFNNSSRERDKQGTLTNSFYGAV